MQIPNTYDLVCEAQNGKGQHIDVYVKYDYMEDGNFYYDEIAVIAFDDNGRPYDAEAEYDSMAEHDVEFQVIDWAKRKIEDAIANADAYDYETRLL